MMRNRHWGLAAVMLLAGSAACGGEDETTGGGAASPVGGGGGGGIAGAGGAGLTGGGSTGGGPSGGAGGGLVSQDCPEGITSDPDVAQALPAALVDTTYPPVTGQSTVVTQADDLQAAIDAASPGDELRLESGATFGPITLPPKAGDGWIVIRTDVDDAALPPEGGRIDPSYAAGLAKILAPANLQAVAAAQGAHHYRLVGLELGTEPGAFTYNLVDFGAGATSDAQLPHHLVIDRCYLRGDPDVGSRRGLALNSKDTAVIGSWFADFKEQGADTQAIAGWGGPGPFKVVNNHLEGAGENVMFGGADPAIADVVPSDIEICRNHLIKPESWRNLSWTEKNLFELKNARRVLFAGNVLDHSWADGQVGFAIVLTPRNQDGTAPWSTVEDLTIVYNVIRHTGSGIAMSGEDDNNASGQQSRVLIAHNLLDDINRTTWGGDGRGFQVVSPDRPTVAVKIDHNTVTTIGNAFLVAGDTGPVGSEFVFTNNLVPKGDYGAFGSGQGEGTSCLEFYFPGFEFLANAIIGATESAYPAGNFFPPTTDAVGFVDFAGGDYALDATSSFASAGTDGRDLGADFVALEAAVAGVAP